MQSAHVYALCQAGAEKALKAEVARMNPELRFAFSRPGFVTFKQATGQSALGMDFTPKWAFARSWGLSLGRVASVSELIQALPGWFQAEQYASSTGGRRWKLHLAEREQHEPGEEPLGFERGLWTKKWAEALQADWKAVVEASGGRLTAEPEFFGAALLEQWVLECVVVEEGQLWIGAYRQLAGRSTWPGGRYPVELPEDSPSRAFLKLEESIAWAGYSVRSGDTAVEIGSAPGGATYALLRKGVNVVGIDPGEMHPRVFAFQDRPSFQHIRDVVAQVPRETLPERVDWLLLDMNVEPRVSLFQVDRLVTRMSDSLLGVILTVKLNQWSFATEIPHWKEHLKAMGLTRVRATQLPANRREICLVGLTRKGQHRQI